MSGLSKCDKYSKGSPFGEPFSFELPEREEAEMPNMPDKPDTWAIALAWLSQHSPILYAAALSCAMAVLRITYGGGTRRQMIVEGAICGGLALTIISGLEFFSLPQSMATFVGGWVGFLGVEKIRSIADRVTDFKLPGRKPE